MKRLLTLSIVLLVVLLVGCSAGSEASINTQENNAGGVSAAEQNNNNAEEAEDGDTVVITEKMFIQQCNDVYLNYNNYKDKQILLEGIYDCYEDPDTGETRYAVIRNGPGCCGNDGVAGFEFEYDGDMSHLTSNDWIEVMGTVKVTFNEETGYEDITLNATYVRKMQIRGADFVTG